ncbi:MAG TPA: PTS sugar transporter subunit IIB [Dermatophilaceae bacterium]
MTRILIICGAGASSSFLAQRMRQAAKKRSVDVAITARSETELETLLSSTDVVLVGPHLSYKFDEINEQCLTAGVVTSILPSKIYGMLDGEKALDLAFATQAKVI